MPEERPPYQGRPPDRPGLHGPRPPFRPAPRPESMGPPPVHTVRVRDGDREIEVSGSAVFVRQVLDDLQNIWARLRGEAPQRPASIRMPDPPAREESLAAVAPDETGD